MQSMGNKRRCLLSMKSSPRKRVMFLRSLLWALLGLFILFFWDAAILKINYGGNWTALFRTGDHFSVPTALRERTFIFPDNVGYDGQFYRYVAHDPFGTNHLLTSFDDAALRYSRILVPATTYLLALGNQNLIDFAYFAVIGLLIFLGGFWLSRWAVLNCQHPAWGLAFAILPASVISSTMMAVDVGVLALSIGFGYYMEQRRYFVVYLLVMLAPLCRETGVLLLAGACLWLLINKEWRLTLLMASAGLPALGWYIYVQTFVTVQAGGSVIPGWVMKQSVTGIFHAMASPASYEAGLSLDTFIRAFDVLSLGGMVLAFVLAGRATFRRPLSPIALTASLYIVLVIAVNNRGFWAVPIGYTRPFSVLLGLLIMLSLSGVFKRHEAWLAWISVSIVSLRVISQFIYIEFFQTLS